MSVSLWVYLVYFKSLVLSDQVNPALTFAMFATRKLNGLRALVYIVAQCLGAFLGAGAVYLALPSRDHIMDFVSKVSSPAICQLSLVVLRFFFVTIQPFPSFGPPHSGSLGVECRSGPGHWSSVHFSDGLHCVHSMWPETAGLHRTRKPGHWIGTLVWSAIRGQKLCFTRVSSTNCIAFISLLWSQYQVGIGISSHFKSSSVE